jgi:alpha-aminoadipate carrier protein LysW
MSATCPECDSPIDVDEFDVDIGDELTCSECGSLLRVSSDSPVELESADDDEFEDDEKDDDGDGEEESDELDDLDDDNDEDDRDDVDDE